MKKAALTLILICLMTLGAVCVQPTKAQSQNDITINADGSISPSTAPISQVGNTYTLTSNVDGTITIHRNNAVFDGNSYTLSGTVQLDSVENVTLKNLTVTGSEFGIVIDSALNVTVTNNTITETGKSVILPGPPVSMGNPTAGIYIYKGRSNIITENNLMNNICGIVFLETSHNLIVENNVTSSIAVALDFYESSYNSIYHNSFIDNTNIVEDDSFGYGGAISLNVWDNGYPFGGNYWSDYLTRYPGATEIDGSGIGDTPYVLYKNNTDRYPLMAPFGTSFMLNYLQEIAPPKISVLSPLNRTYSNRSVPLIFELDKAVNWEGYSLDGEQNVTVSGNSTLATLTYGRHTVTVYANSTFGFNGTSDTVSFTIAKPFPTVTVAAVSGAVAAVVVVAGLLVYFKKRKH